MGNFISWIEKDQELLFLMSKDIRGSYGKETFKGYLDSGLIGHVAIRELYNVKNGECKSNKSFWDGKLPQQIKNAWNQGQLDGMLQCLELDDLEHIMMNAPENFTRWTIAQKYGQDFQSMEKSSLWYERIVGLLAAQDYESMKKDSDWDIRMVGMVATQEDYESMKKDPSWGIRMVGMHTYTTRMVGRFAYSTEDYDVESIKKDRSCGARLAGFAAINSYESMKKDTDKFVRIAGMVATRDHESMKKDRSWIVRLVGLAATQDYDKLVRPKL